jgi:septum formation protein
MLKLVLASQSPRRRELLQDAGYEFAVSLVKVSEIFDENLNPREVASHLATVKARACLGQDKLLKTPGFLVLAADTVVAVGDQILGKPKNATQAEEYLHLLSGKSHSVITGLCLAESGGGKTYVGADSTQVTFHPLADAQVREYVAGGEPMDKAGAYAIQGEGQKFVSSFTGSWSNVVGLPLELLAKVLRDEGWNVGRRASGKA